MDCVQDLQLQYDRPFLSQQGFLCLTLIVQVQTQKSPALELPGFHMAVILILWGQK